MAYTNQDDIRADFDYALHVWVDRCGAFEDQEEPFLINKDDHHRFGYWVDLNKFKVALVELIRAYGGNEDLTTAEPHVISGGS